MVLLKILCLSVDYLLMIKCIKKFERNWIYFEPWPYCVTSKKRGGGMDVLFSINKHIGSPKLFFSTLSEFVPVHRHLGLVVPYDLGWSQYLNKLTSTACK